MKVPPEPIENNGTIPFWRQLDIATTRRILPDVSWSLANNLLMVVSGLLFLKIIGRFVPAAQYGEASLVLGVLALLNQFIANPLLSERLRLYFDELQKASCQPFTLAIEGLLIKVSFLILLVYAVIGGLFYLKGNTSYFQLFLPVLLLIFLQPHMSAAFGQLEAHRQYRQLSFVQPLSNVLQVPLLLIAIWAPLRGAVAVVTAQAVALLCVFVILQVKIRRSAGVEVAEGVPSELATPMVTSFGWSLYAFSFASWVMQTSDRYLIDHFGTKAEIGIYVLNYAFWAIPFSVVNSWVNGFSRPRLYARAANSEWGAALQAIGGALAAGALISILGTAVIYFSGHYFANLILGEKYWHSQSLVMLIAVAHIFFVVGHTASTYFIAIKRMNAVWISSLAAAALNLGLNIYCLPKWGIIAAAFSTLCAYGFWAITMLISIAVTSRRLKSDQPAS